MRPRLLVIGHADPSGRHGLAADLRAAESIGAEPLPVVTAITVGDPAKPHSLSPVPSRTLSRQLEVALEQQPDAVLIGVLAKPRHAKLVAHHLFDDGPSAIVLEPLSAAFDTPRLVSKRVFVAVRRHLVPEARTVVVGADDAGLLVAGRTPASDDPKEVGERLLGLGARSAWIRAAAHEGRRVDVLVDADGIGLLDYPHADDSAEPHTAAAALAALLALGTKLREAVDRAHRHALGLDRELLPVL